MRFGSTLAIAWLSAFLALGACDGPNINGSVVDDFGTALDGVEVSIANTELRAKTDSKGRYRLTYVPGRFEVRFQKDAYEPTSVWLEVATRESVPVSSQTLRSKKAREAVIGAFAKTIDFLHARYVEHCRANNRVTPGVQSALDKARSMFSANIGKARLGSAFMRHVTDFPTGSTLVIPAPAYIRLGFDRLLAFDETDRIEIPPDARAYIGRLRECDETIARAMDGAISLDDPKFVAATEVCYLVFTGAPLTAAALVLLGGEADLSSNKDSASDLRKMVADERARRSRR